jgi:hypothetical protein
MCGSPHWGSRSWLLTKEATVTWRLAKCWVDVDTGWVLVLCARLALNQCFSVIVVIAAWATDAHWLLLLLLLLLRYLLLLLRNLVLRRSLESLLLWLLLSHCVHAPINILPDS